jgi:hypothetical protein
MSVQYLAVFVTQATSSFSKDQGFFQIKVDAQGFQRLSNKALAMTLTELSAMAPPAITGFK